MKRRVFRVFAFGLLIVQAAVGASQDEHKPAAKTVDVRIKVAISGGVPIPDDMKVEVSAQEQACGELNDPRKTLDSNGEATFVKMPLCVISVKALLKGYIQVGIEMNGKKLASRAVDLRQYANPLSVVMEKEQ